MYRTSRDRTFRLFDDVNAKSVEELCSKMAWWQEESPREWMTIYICFFGGFVAFGFGFYDFVMDILKPKLQTVVTGVVESMALPVYLAGEHRVCSRSSAFYFHRIGRKWEKPFSLDLTDLGVIVPSLKRDEDIFSTIVQKRTAGKISKQKAKDMMNSATYIYSKEAKKLGLVHEII